MMVNGGKKDKLSDKSKSVASKVVNAIVAKLEKASQALLGNIISALNEPKNKVKAKEQIKEQARVSIQAKLKEKQKQVFERFEKLNEYAQGTGLGLSICKLTVDKWGGSIWIDPDYERGARFVVSHPL